MCMPEFADPCIDDQLNLCTSDYDDSDNWDNDPQVIEPGIEPDIDRPGKLCFRSSILQADNLMVRGNPQRGQQTR